MKGFKKGVIALMTIAMLGTSSPALAQPSGPAFASGSGISAGQEAPRDMGRYVVAAIFILGGVVYVLLPTSSSHQHNS